MDLRFVGILLAAAAAGGPAALAGGAHQGTGPPPPVPPTIMFDQPSSVTVGTPVSLSASVSPAGGLPLLFQSATRSVCTVPVNQPTVTTLTAGTCTITAFQDGKPPQAATAVTRSFQVQAPATPTITFNQPSSVTVGTPVSLSASVSPAGGLPLLFQSATRSVCTVPVNQPTVTTLTAGTCTITAFQDGKPPQAATAVTRSFQVQAPAGPIPQTITFGPPPNATVGTPVTLSAHASSGLAVQFSSDTPSACTVTKSTVTTRAAGTCTITAAQSGSARYAAAPAVTRSFRESPIGTKGARPPAGLLAAAAIILAVGAVALTLARHRRRLPPHPPTAPGLSVRAVPQAGPPRLVSVRTTGTDATTTVRIEPSSGTSTTTIEEARP